MGGLVGSIFDLTGGDPTGKENKALGDLWNYQNNLGEKSTSQGLGWESDILSGDPSKIAEALAPEIKSGQDMVQQQAEQNAAFHNRGGGVNSSTQAAQSGERGNIIGLIGGLQQGAAGALTGAGENLMNMGSGNIMNQAQLDLQNRQRQVGDVSGIASGVASIAAPFFGGAAAGGGLDPASFADIYSSGKASIPSLNPLDDASLYTGAEQQMP